MYLEEPYEYILSGRMVFLFTTVNSVDYKVEFVQNILNFDGLLLVFEMIITFENSNIVLNPPLDKRVELTIVEILRGIFAENDKSVIYVCDNSDNRHHSRKRKFDSWYNKFKMNDIEKFDSEINLAGTELLTTLLIHQNNPFKKIIIDLFINQKDQLENK